jgi:hypothetical protein
MKCCRAAGEHHSVMKIVCQGFQNVERLGRGDDDSPVVSFATRFEVQHRSFRDPLAQYSDLIDAAHDAPHLRNRHPRIEQLLLG